MHPAGRKEGEKKGRELPGVDGCLCHHCDTVTCFSSTIVNEVIKAEGEESTAHVTQTEVALQRQEGNSAHLCALHLRGMK